MPNVGIIVTTREDGSIEVKSLGKDLTKTGVEGEKSAKKTTKAWDKVKAKSGGWTKSVKGLASSWLGVTAAIGTMVLAIGAVIESASEMEDFEQRLISLTKSEVVAAEKLKSLTEYASTTPFQLKGIVEAGVQAEAFGLTIEENIGQIGDLAAFMGINIVEASAAMGRAFAGGVGAADILKDRGVIQLIKNFARLKMGITDITKLTLPEFRKVLVAAIADPDGKISGAAERLAGTVSGMASMFWDATTKLATNIGSFLEPLTKFVIQRSTALVGFLADMTAESESLKGSLGGVKEGFTDIAQEAKATAEEIRTAFEQLGLIPKKTLESQAQKEIEAFKTVMKSGILTSNDEMVKAREALFERLEKISTEGGQRIVGIESDIMGTGPLVKRFDEFSGTLTISYNQLGNQLAEDSEDIGQRMADGLIGAPEGALERMGDTTKITLKGVTTTIDEFLVNTLALATTKFPILTDFLQKHLDDVTETELKLTSVTTEELRKRVVAYETNLGIILKDTYSWRDNMIAAYTAVFEASRKASRESSISIPSGNGGPLPPLPISIWDNFQSGTNFVPRNMPAFLHQGEAVIPAAQNPNNPDNRQFDQRQENHFHYGAAPENQMEAEDMMGRAMRKVQDRVF